MWESKITLREQIEELEESLEVERKFSERLRFENFELNNKVNKLKEENEFLIEEREAKQEMLKEKTAAYYNELFELREKLRIVYQAHVELLEKTVQASSKKDEVRCGECIHNVENWNHDKNDATDYTDIVCDYFMTDGMGPDDYCSHGERKEK